MPDYVGLDVSLDQTSLCVLDAAGQIVRETKLDTDPDAIAEYLGQAALVIERVGLEAGPLSQWLHAGLVAHGLPAVCIETRHTKAALGAMPVKTDRGDARGIAQLMRTGWFKAVHVKTHQAQEWRLLLTQRRLLVNKLIDVEAEIRGTLRGFGLKMGRVGRAGFVGRVRELLADRPSLLRVVEPVLLVQAMLLSQREALHRMVLQAVREEEVCRRMMTVPGVGPITALAFRATVDKAERFAHSRDVGAHFGLTPRRYQSGETDRSGTITKTGDALMRHALYEAATSMLVHATKPSALRNWALVVAKRRGLQKARVALARRLAVVLHRMWRDGSVFQPQGRLPTI
ncbi:IS110 family transposase ISAzs32 [Methylobacterium adhaesivum]|uniref:IS110 family transposase n=1 Tax=Methylobacterium adhaesivum TaxID=333297 RepID=A0ABT8BLU0_9HYPH|nr:IS110 family transposase [Methylobacterium adhaesivum]MDN3593086.1 IS110 family transposase [Methylobacterium adhaesivum]GJD31095.1 IS110 family transposase ISAzs32 [Methylobacterium adhaesivum]